MTDYDAAMQEEYDYGEYLEERLAQERQPLPLEEWRRAAGDWWKLR